MIPLHFLFLSYNCKVQLESTLIIFSSFYEEFLVLRPPWQYLELISGSASVIIPDGLNGSDGVLGIELWLSMHNANTLTPVIYLFPHIYELFRHLFHSLCHKPIQVFLAIFHILYIALTGNKF